MKKSFWEDVLSTLSRCFAVLIVLVVACIALSGLRMVKSGEVAVVLRFGKLVGETAEEQIHQPGLLFCFPYFIDEVVTIPTGNIIEQTVDRHYSLALIESRDAGYVITGDQNIAHIYASVKYTISDPVAYALNITSIAPVIDACVSNAMLEVASCTSVDDILTSGKEAYIEAVLAESQRKLDECGAGIAVQAIELTDVKMPEDVRETYEQVNAATVEASTLLKEAQQHRNTLIPYAESRASSIVSTATYSYSTAVSAATSDLSEFWGILDEYKAQPETIRARLYNEKMAAALSKIGKVLLVNEGDGKIFINWG